MNRSQEDSQRESVPVARILETVTAGVLLTVLAALAGMIVAAYRTQTDGISAGDVVGIILLLLTALGLVTIVALLHTRR